MKLQAQNLNMYLQVKIFKRTNQLNPNIFQELIIFKLSIQFNPNKNQQGKFFIKFIQVFKKIFQLDN